MGGDVERKG